jgi:hypothetical protein
MVGSMSIRMFGSSNTLKSKLGKTPASSKPAFEPSNKPVATSTTTSSQDNQPATAADTNYSISVPDAVAVAPIVKPILNQLPNVDNKCVQPQPSLPTQTSTTVVNSEKTTDKKQESTLSASSMARKSIVPVGSSSSFYELSNMLAKEKTQGEQRVRYFTCFLLTFLFIYCDAMA